MPVSESQKRATTKYVKSNYDKFSLYTTKGKKDLIKEHCKKYNYPSVNDFLNIAIENQINNDIRGNIETCPK